MKTILVADGDASILNATADSLQQAGYAVLTASNGREALGCLVKGRPDLVVMDLALPLLDGEEVLRSVRAHEDYAAIPMILTGPIDGGLDVAARYGVRALGKPFRLPVLLHAVQEALT